MSSQPTSKRLVALTQAPAVLPFTVTVRALRNMRARGVWPDMFITIGGKVFIDLDAVEFRLEKERAKARRNAQLLSD